MIIDVTPQTLLDQLFALIEHYKPPAVSAAASLLTVIVSSIAAFFAYRAYRKQAGQLALARKHDLRAQAAKVTAWIESRNVSTSRDWAMSLLGGDSFTRTIGHTLTYVNASDLPIYKVDLIYKSASGKEIRAHFRERIMPTVSRYESDSPRFCSLFPETSRLTKRLREDLPQLAEAISNIESSRKKRAAKRNRISAFADPAYSPDPKAEVEELIEQARIEREQI